MIWFSDLEQMNEARHSNVFHRFHLLVRETRCYIDDNDYLKSIRQKFFLSQFEEWIWQEQVIPSYNELNLRQLHSLEKKKRKNKRRKKRGKSWPINSQLESTAQEVSLNTLVLIFGGCTGLARGIFFVSLVPSRLARLSTEEEIKGVLSSVSSGSSQSIGCNWLEFAPVGVCSQPGSLCRYLFVAGLFLGRLLGIIAAFWAIASAGSA